MAENIYLKTLREQYETLQKSIEGYQNRAVEAKRDLTEDELRTVKEQGEKGLTLYAQIESLTEIETRNAKVTAMQAQIQQALAGTDGAGPKVEPDTQLRTTGGGTTKDRDPGHYTRGGANSFFTDLYRSRSGDEDAARRLVEHNRALSTGTHGPGVVPPNWLTEEFELLARQGRALASAVRNVALGDDPRPMTLPKQTAGTDTTATTVAEQVSENTPLAANDDWDSDVDTVTPKPTAGKQTVSRQMIDMSNPAIDQLIYGDLISVYNLRVENKVGAAVLAAGPAAISTGVGGAALFRNMDTDETNGSDLAVRAAVAVRKARKLPANILAMTTDRYGEYLKLKDNTGRPLIPLDTAGPMNVIGVGSVAVDGRIHGLGVIATDAMGTGALPDTFAAIRASDTILFESNMLRFRFEEVSGPESIVLGIWGYTAVIVRQGGKGVQRVIVAV